MSRIVKCRRTGETFIETSERNWKAALKAWNEDHSRPCPMPEGHLMFEMPEAYDCVLVEPAEQQRDAKKG